MFRGLRNDQVPLLYQINGLSDEGYDYFKLDNAEYSLFPYEQEVILNAGLDFEIIDISE
jgi:hypothetical protein